MNTLDIAIIGLMLLGTLLGVYWGLIRQVLALIGLVAGISIAGRTYPEVADFLAGFGVTAPDLLNLIAFILVFMVVSLIVSALATMLRLFVGLLFLGMVDHILGGLLGFIQSLLVIAALLAAFVAFPAVGLTDMVAESRLAGWWARPVELVLPLLPERFQLPNTMFFDQAAAPSRPLASMRRPIR